MGGPRAGLPPEASSLATIKKKFPEVPLVLGSGGRKDNIRELLKIADGVIIGTSIKKDGVLWKQVDAKRASEFVKEAKGL